MTITSSPLSAAANRVVPATGRRKGRKPTTQSNARNCRERVTLWKLSPEGKRQPRTQSDLAVELGISKQMISYYAQRVPESIEELVDSTEREALSRYPNILNTLCELAEKGSVEAIKVYIRHLAEPRRPEQRKQSATAQDLCLQVAIRTLIQPPQETSTVADCALTIEDKIDRTLNSQISSNSRSDEESTS